MRDLIRAERAALNASLFVARSAELLAYADAPVEFYRPWCAADAWKGGPTHSRNLFDNIKQGQCGEFLCGEVAQRAMIRLRGFPWADARRETASAGCRWFCRLTLDAARARGLTPLEAVENMKVGRFFIEPSRLDPVEEDARLIHCSASCKSEHRSDDGGAPGGAVARRERPSV